MLKIKKNIVTATIQTALIAMTAAVLNPKIGSTLLATTPLVIFTAWVRGKTAKAITWAALGKEVSGKKVPLKKNIGVRKRNEGKLKKSMFGAAAVKHMAMEENIKPTKNAMGITSRNKGLLIKPNAATTASTMVALIVALVAPHRSSPATTSSTLTGVAMIASKVFW
jgi:hypothetical protein